MRVNSSPSKPRTVLSGEDSPPPPPDPFRACAAEEELLRERRAQRRRPRTPPRPPPPTYEDLVEEDQRRRSCSSTTLFGLEPVSSEIRGFRARSVGTQVEMLKEMPKVVFLTPSGTCSCDVRLLYTEPFHEVPSKGGVR